MNNAKEFDDEIAAQNLTKPFKEYVKSLNKGKLRAFDVHFFKGWNK